MDRAYESSPSQAFFVVALFWALFAVDLFDMVRFLRAPTPLDLLAFQALTSDPMNDGLYASLLFTLVAFSIEIVVCSICKPHYL